MSGFLERFNRGWRAATQPEPVVEERAIVSVPWDVGGPLRPSLVTADQAQRLAPVYAAWRLLASSVASLPLQGYRKVGDQRRPLDRPPVLFERPSVQGTTYDWVYRAVHSMCSRGNAVGLVMARDALAYPTAIEWLHPDEVHVDQDSQGASFARPVWYWNGRRVPTDDIVHIPWFPVAGKVWGLSPVEAYAASVNIGLAAKQYAVDWFDGGGVPPGTFRNTAKTIDEEIANAVKARLVRAIRSHQPIVYGADWEFNPVAISPHEAQFVQTWELTANDVAAIYGIWPEKIGGRSGDSMTYANVEARQIDFVTDCLRPWLVKLEAAFFPLLPRPQYVRFNADAIIRADLMTRYRSYAVARQIGLLSIDEIRQLEDLEPLPNGEGADYTPLGKAGNSPDPGDQPEEPQTPLPRPRAVS